MRCAKSYQDIESPDDYKDNSDYFEEFIERYIEKWGEQSDEDFDIIHLYWYNIVSDYFDESILDMSVNEMRESLVWYFKRSSEDKAKDIWVLQEQYRKQKEINKELVDENESLKAQIEKMKWHKVSDGNLPKDRHNVYVVYMNGYYQLENTIASFRHKYWIINGLKTECEIIAWCELPKWEIKENE